MKTPENLSSRGILADTHLFKANNRNIRKRGNIYSKLIIKTPERCQLRRSSFLLLPLNIFHTFFCGMNCVNDSCTLVLSSSARKLQNYKTNQKNFKKKVSSYVSSLIFFSAIIFPVCLSFPLYTTPYVPSPIFSSCLNKSMILFMSFGTDILMFFIYLLPIKRTTKIKF